MIEVGMIERFATMSWEQLYIVVIGMVFIGAFLYVSKKLLDEETYGQIKASIMSMMVDAEHRISGAKRGDEKLQLVEKMVYDSFEPEQIALVNKKGGVPKLVKKLLPFVTAVVPLFLNNKKR